jgi:prolyl-tRNA synthetase
MADGMRMTRLFGHTLREAPADAELASHQLLLRAGFIDQLAAGIYSYMPLGRRTKRRVEQIVREEMDRAGAQEVLLPAIHPLELWERSGRDRAFGEALFVLPDRRERKLVLAPTHEEAITRLFTDHARSYRDLPVTLYQVQTKFRDEARPRGGLVRVREFTMKDAYSFDLDDAGLDVSYDAMFEAYRRIFARAGIPTVAAEADSGAIGGKGSQEFLFLTEAGEDTVLLCECGYAANAEKAEFVRPPALPEEPLPVEEVATPGATTIEALAELLGVPAAKTAKAVFYMAVLPDDRTEPVFAVLRGDLQVNEVKLANALAGAGGPPRLRTMTDLEVRSAGLVAGYASPVGVASGVSVVADLSIPDSPNLVAGANREGYHLRNVNHGRDWEAATVADIALAEPGHRCARCFAGAEGEPGDGEGGHTLRAERAIELGHVFRLGRIYTEAFESSVLDEKGEQRVPTMGCYGIGIDRIMASAVEAHHDGDGIAWPVSLAPYDVHLVALGASRDPEVGVEADALFDELRAAGLTVLYDDRDESPGVKFADADLMGLPLRLTVSSRNRKEGAVELQRRAGGEAERVARDAVVAHASELYAAELAALDVEPTD